MKKMNKTRLIALFLCCAALLSLSVLADDGGYYSSDESGTAEVPDSIDTITISREDLPFEWDENAVSIDLDTEEVSTFISSLFSGETLTPDGNLTLVDDILQQADSTVEDKQFITLQTKNGNYFYLVIDRSGDTDNVYFLNLVDESDLYALLEDGDVAVSRCTCKDKCVAGDVDTTCPVCSKNMSECTGVETVTTTEETTIADIQDEDEEADVNETGNKTLLAVLLLLLAGGGAAYYFKYIRNKSEVTGTRNLDDYCEDDDDSESENKEEPNNGDDERRADERSV